MNKFECDKCGKCCESLNNSELYNDLNNGEGICVYYDNTTHLCTIYENRPLKCNVEKAYSLFKDYITHEEYLKLNYEACKKLKEGK